MSICNGEKNFSIELDTPFSIENDKSFYTKTGSDGNMGIGKLPDSMLPYLDDVANEFYNTIPDKNVSTHHIYYTESPPKIKTKIDLIQNHEFWDQMITTPTSSQLLTFSKTMPPPPLIVNRKHLIEEMNEIYYSNPAPFTSRFQVDSSSANPTYFAKRRLYGSAANLIPHRDCILFNFTGVSCYRVLIGLTDGNCDTITHFVNYDLGHKINRGDYIIFDFDKTLHQVIKEGATRTPRILIKLHYIVCPASYSPYYVWFVSQCYIYYYRIARYTEQLGTDPKTFVGYFWGLIWEYPFHPYFRHIVLSIFAVKMLVYYSWCQSVVWALMYTWISCVNMFLLNVYMELTFWSKNRSSNN